MLEHRFVNKHIRNTFANIASSTNAYGNPTNTNKLFQQNQRHLFSIALHGGGLGVVVVDRTRHHNALHCILHIIFAFY